MSWPISTAPKEVKRTELSMKGLLRRRDSRFRRGGSGGFGHPASFVIVTPDGTAPERKKVEDHMAGP